MTAKRSASTSKPRTRTTRAAAGKAKRHVLAERRDRVAAPRDEFAAIKSGLDTTRQAFYGNTGANRLPNTKADDTRRSRTLIGGSGDRHLSQLDLWTEREISRFLYDQNAIFGGMIETWAAETIQCGFRLKPDTGDTALDEAVKMALFGWDGDGGWCGECDARGLGHLWDILTLAEETELKDGDHAFYFDADGNNGRGSVAIIEGDRILSPYGAYVPDGFTLSNGIMWNASGYPVAVFVADIAPTYAFCSVENGRFHELWKPWDPTKSGVVLSISLRSPSASRRQPWLATAVRALDDVDDVFVAVRIQLRNAACRSTFTRIGDWDAYKEWLQLVDPGGAEAPAPVEGLEHSPNPGDHVLVNPGEEVGALDTNQPGNNFSPFMDLQLPQVGLPIGMCLEESLRIFQKSFSSSRMAIDATRRRYLRRQPQIKRRKLVPILTFAVAMLQKRGVLPADPRCFRIRVTFPGWPYMEPLKDAQASAVLVNNKLRSRRTCATEIGDDYDAELPLIEAESEMFPDPKQAAKSTPATADAEDMTDEGTP